MDVTSLYDDLLDDNIPVNKDDDNKDDNNQDDKDSQEQGDFISMFLKDHGIENNKISFKNDNDEIEEIDFNELEDSEKLEILKELSDPGLSDHEKDVVNYLRKNNSSFEEVINYFKTKAIEEYISENGEITKVYSVDEYTDDEIYLSELKSKYSNMTEDELKTELDTAKSNDDLFKKKVEVIRSEYKKQEDDLKNQEKLQKEESYNNLKKDISTSISKFNEISLDHSDPESDSLVIEESEKTNILNYLLNKDSEGKTQFDKDLVDSDNMIQLAWFKLYGKDIISEVTKYWKEQLKTERKNNNKPKPEVVISKEDKDKNTNKHKTISSLYEDLI